MSTEQRVLVIWPGAHFLSCFSSLPAPFISDLSWSYVFFTLRAVLLGQLLSMFPAQMPSWNCSHISKLLFHIVLLDINTDLKLCMSKTMPVTLPKTCSFQNILHVSNWHLHPVPVTKILRVIHAFSLSDPTFSSSGKTYQPYLQNRNRIQLFFTVSNSNTRVRVSVVSKVHPNWSYPHPAPSVYSPPGIHTDHFKYKSDHIHPLLRTLQWLSHHLDEMSVLHLSVRTRVPRSGQLLLDALLPTGWVWPEEGKPGQFSQLPRRNQHVINPIG